MEVIVAKGTVSGVRHATEFWASLEAGREAIRDVCPEEYLAAGGDPAALNDPYPVALLAAHFGATDESSAT